MLSGVIWRNSVAGLTCQPEEGMEVVATGRLTTFPGQSKYQIVIEDIAPAGVGALMAMLEKRRQALAAEGLFDAGRKKPLPYLPRVIGVVTSPSGAVIRDILHRLSERFPVHVLVWPCAMQGKDCAPQVAAAIRGFCRIPANVAPQPDVIIVARGGGSVEDLWGFNEEIVVRAVADCPIPLISAVGHETDTTLIDHAADRRAPTPSAAAEMAVPVRRELVTVVSGLEDPSPARARDDAGPLAPAPDRPPPRPAAPRRHPGRAPPAPRPRRRAPRPPGPPDRAAPRRAWPAVRPPRPGAPPPPRRRPRAPDAHRRSPRARAPARPARKPLRAALDPRRAPAPRRGAPPSRPHRQAGSARPHAPLARAARGAGPRLRHRPRRRGKRAAARRRHRPPARRSTSSSTTVGSPRSPADPRPRLKRNRPRSVPRPLARTTSRARCSEVGPPTWGLIVTIRRWPRTLLRSSATSSRRSGCDRIPLYVDNGYAG